MLSADDRWHAALSAVGAAEAGRDEAFAELVAEYGAPPRHYHTFEHASSVVDAVLEIVNDGDDWAPVVLAAWFHDAVYDSSAGPGVNEGASAVFASQVLTRLRVTSAGIGEVVRLVCLTVDHQPNDGDRNGALLCDADLSALAAAGDVYDANVRNIREEFAQFDDETWRLGRRAVLCSFLDRPTLFHSPGGRERWEARARINISSELATLD